MRTFPRIVAAAALAVAATVPALLHAAPAQAAATAAFVKAAEWTGGYVGNFAIRNDTDQTMNGWRLEFELPEGTTIRHPWGVVPTVVGRRHVFVNQSWNGTLSPGASTSVGFVASGDGVPSDCTLNGAPCDGVPSDIDAPTAPANMRITISDGTRLHWEPSTDDSGSVRYEVFDGATRLGTVTEPTYVVSPTNVLPPKVYIFNVRAVDSQGNVSPHAFVPMGTLFDEVPPPAPGNLVVGRAGPALRLSWTPAPTAPGISVPPIAGYEIHVDGELVDSVGTAQATVPMPAPGTHTVGVRAFNAVGLYADPLEITHTVP